MSLYGTAEGPTILLGHPPTSSVEIAVKLNQGATVDAFLPHEQVEYQSFGSVSERIR